MGKSAVITARVDEATLASLDRIAAAHGRSRSWIVAEAVRRFAKSEAEFLDFVETGIGEADRGELIEQDEIETWFEARHAGRIAAE